MKLDSSQYEDVIQNIEYFMSDIENSYTNGKKSDNEYITFQLPKINNDKFSIKYIVKSTDGKTNLLVFKSPQTLGIKILEDDGTIACEYSISRKNGVQVILLNLANETFLRRTSILDSKTNTYVFDKTTEIYPAQNLENYYLDNVDPFILDSGIVVVNKIVYDGSNGIPKYKLHRSYGYKDSSKQINFLNLNKYPELSQIDAVSPDNSLSVLQHFASIESMFVHDSSFIKAHNIVKHFLSISKDSDDVGDVYSNPDNNPEL